MNFVQVRFRMEQVTGLTGLMKYMAPESPRTINCRFQTAMTGRAISFQPVILTKKVF